MEESNLRNPYSPSSHLTRGVSEPNTSSNKFVVDEFIASIENIDELRGEVKGAEEIIVFGEIISHIENRRFASVP